MTRLIEAMAAERGQGPAGALAPEARYALEAEALTAADSLPLRSAGQEAETRTAIEGLLAELYDINCLIFEMTEDGHGPNGRLH
jgi:hypothetical protein